VPTLSAQPLGLTISDGESFLDEPLSKVKADVEGFQLGTEAVFDLIFDNSGAPTSQCKGV
jgi:hypothetical protein